MKKRVGIFAGPIAGAGLQHYISENGNFEEKWLVTEGQYLLKHFRATPVDVLVIDFDHRITLFKHLADLAHAHFVGLVFTRNPIHPRVVYELYRHHCRGFVRMPLDDADMSRLRGALIKFVRDEPEYFDERVASREALYQGARDLDLDSKDARIITMLAQGRSASEVATHMKVGVKSLNETLAKVAKALRFGSVAELMVYARSPGWSVHKDTAVEVQEEDEVPLAGVEAGADASLSVGEGC